MKPNSIIYRYIFAELIPPFLVTLAFFTFVFLMTQLLEIINLVVNYRVSLGSVLLMIFYTTPFFLQFVIPMSIMMAVLLTFLRLSKDNEIIILKAGGVSVVGLLPPVLLFCLIGWGLTSFMAIYGLPNGKMALKELAIKVISSNLNIGIRERTFNDKFDGVILYVNEIDSKNKQLNDVFIEDQRTQGIVSTVVAPKARLYSDPDNFVFQMRLFDGTINQVNLENRSAHTIQFETYDMSLAAKKPTEKTGGGRKDEEEMNLTELRQYIKEATEKDDQYYLTLMEFHKKFSYPVTCFALGILGLPLGIQSRSAKKSFGIGLGLIFYLFYYIMLSAGWVFGEAGVYPPVIGMWLPNIVTGSLGIYLIYRTARERNVNLYAVSLLFDKIQHRFFKKGTPSD
jgi:lipopolysaccharide export system permease protein